MPATALEVIVALVVVAVAAALQGVVGMGFNIVSVPILALINPAFAPVPSMVVSLILTALAFRRERAHADTTGVMEIMVGRIPGGIVGVGLLAIATARLLDLLIAGSVLLAVVALAFMPALDRNRITNAGVGFVAGITGVVSAIGGPPVALLYKDEKGPAIRATLALVFLIGSAMSLLFRTIGGHVVASDLQFAALFAAAVVVGFAASTRFNARIPGARLRTPILMLSAAAAVALGLRGLLG